MSSVFISRHMLTPYIILFSHNYQINIKTNMCTISWMGLVVLAFCKKFQENLSMCVLLFVQHMENYLAFLIEVQAFNVIARSSPLEVDWLYFVLKHILIKNSQHFCERPIGQVLIGSSGLINSYISHHLIPIYDFFNIGYLLCKIIIKKLVLK